MVQVGRKSTLRPWFSLTSGAMAGPSTPYINKMNPAVSGECAPFANDGSRRRDH